jgi:hypothetical protein
MGQDAQREATDLPDGASVFWVTAGVTRAIGLNRLAISVFLRRRLHRAEGV